MKKLLSVIFAYFMVVAPSLAVDLNTDNSKSQDYIINHGYSPETARLIDLQDAQINGTKTKYKSSDPDWYTTNKKVNFVRRVFMYFDCNLDSGNFGKSKINTNGRYDDL